MSEKDYTTISAHVPGDVAKKLRARAAREDRSVSKVAGRILLQALASEVVDGARVAAEIERQASVEVRAEQGSQAGAQEAAS
jgi:plasmid stability protein